MRKHLILYDGTCAFCLRSIQFIIRHDKKKIFVFAPLQGETAQKFLKNIPSIDSLVLVENFEAKSEFFQSGQSIFRILWLLGGLWTLAGWISFFPPILYNWGYRLVASHRHMLVNKESCPIINAKDQKRFLP